MKIQNKTILIVDSENEVAPALARFLYSRTNKIVLFGSDEQKQKAGGQAVQGFNYVVGTVSDLESVKKLYDYFGKGFQAIDIIVQVSNTFKHDTKAFGSDNNLLNRKVVAENLVHTTAEWTNDILNPEDLQEYFIPIMLREREAQVITIFREKKRNPWFILPYQRAKSYSNLYSKIVRRLLSKTHIKVTDVFMPDSKVSDSGLKRMIEAVEKGKDYVYL